MIVFKWRHALDNTPRLTLAGPGMTLLVKDKVLWLGDSPTKIAFSTANEADAFAENLLEHVSRQVEKGESIFDLDKLAFVVSCEAKNKELDALICSETERALKYNRAIKARRESLAKAQKEHEELGIKIDSAKGTHAELRKVLEEMEIRVVAQKQRKGELERGLSVTNSKIAKGTHAELHKELEKSEADEKRMRRARSRRRGEP